MATTMRKHVLAFALLVPFADTATAETLMCKDFLAMGRNLQRVFVSGLVDGMATAHGVSDTFAKHLKSAATSADEVAGIEKMNGIPQQYLGKACCRSKAEITERIVKGCIAKTNLPVGNMLTDVMSGDL